jgi:methyl-accepting chemotaxis protein
VVAGQVRQLAQRSAQAAREIKTLIQASLQRISDGAQLVEWPAPRPSAF